MSCSLKDKCDAMYPRGKLLVKKARENNISDIILESTAKTNVSDTKCFTDANEYQILFDVPLEKPFKLPENILCEIKNENLVTLVTDSSEEKKFDSENLNKTIEIEYGEIIVPLNENLLTLQHDTANETDIAEINYNDNKTEGSGDELFQLDDTAECFDENLREEKDSESDFDLNDNHKEERKRKLEYSRKLSQTKRLREEEYREHIEKKKEAEAAKKLAKDTASDEKLVVTMDLQSVLLAPKLEASAIYYKQKLQIHNFTVYALNDKKVDLYVWHEANGNVTANEFTTCIVDYIKMSIENKQSYKHVVLISDGCGYQNRNKVLSSALLNVAVELQITIEQLVLERGHTMMEADAVHSSLDA
ncbi:hypothetical protein CBL_08476 [Carabus blaptoides fortunei]